MWLSFSTLSKCSDVCACVCVCPVAPVMNILYGQSVSNLS